MRQERRTSLTMTMECCKKKKKLSLRLPLSTTTATRTEEEDNKQTLWLSYTADNDDDEDDENKYRKNSGIAGQGRRIRLYVNRHQKNIFCFSMWMGLVLFACFSNSNRSNHHHHHFKTATTNSAGGVAMFDVSMMATMSSKQLERLFADQRHSLHGSALHAVLEMWRDKFDYEMQNNVAGGTRWARPYLLPGVQGIAEGGNDLEQQQRRRGRALSSNYSNDDSMQSIDTKSFFYLTTQANQLNKNQKEKSTRMKWEEEWDEMIRHGLDKTPLNVDYNDKGKYTYTPISDYYNENIGHLPTASQYPKLKSLKSLMDDWPQDEDYHGTIHETVAHFDYSDPTQLDIARKFRDAELPFKLINVKELLLAGKRWDDDEYVAQSINHPGIYHSSAEESQNNFFMSFTPQEYKDWWTVSRKGVPPVRFVPDMDYTTWARHARYADATRLSSDKPHYYWECSASGKERFVEDKTTNKASFIARDLPSFVSPNATFFVPNPNDNERGVQCRFGERGVVSWIHIDETRNHIAMLSGARRYIMSPPFECNRFGFSDAVSPGIHLSPLNLGNLNHLNENDDDKQSDDGVGMSDLERYWLGRAGQAQALETVLKAGEVLFVPSFWLHYLVNLQKSSQCNVHMDPGKGHPVFGTLDTFAQCKAESKTRMI